MEKSFPHHKVWFGFLLRIRGWKVQSIQMKLKKWLASIQSALKISALALGLGVSKEGRVEKNQVQNPKEHSFPLPAKCKQIFKKTSIYFNLPIRIVYTHGHLIINAYFVPQN